MAVLGVGRRALESCSYLGCTKVKNLKDINLYALAFVSATSVAVTLFVLPLKKTLFVVVLFLVVITLKL
jgi:hypothetical protein